MKALLYAGLALLALGLQITVVPDLALWGIRPDVVLVTVLAVTIRWRDRFVFVYAAALGVALDSFTHGVLGVSGISFFAAAVGARLVGGAMYGDNIVSSSIAVFALSLAEGIVFVTLFRILDPQVPWGSWTLTRVMPEAFYNALIAPAVFTGLARLERWTPLPARS
ncbi:MAG: rod shape-determining protein MreD [SAR324 cluster bacterium]